MSMATKMKQVEFCNGDEAVLEGYYHYTCPVCGFKYCFECFKRILLAETGCPNCLASLTL